MAETPPRVALITGGASGIGAACAAALRHEAISVASVDVHGCETADLSIEADVTNLDAVGAAVETTETELGPIGYLITAAGYYTASPIASVTPDQWRGMLGVHVLGTVITWHAVFPGMLARRVGRVCAIGSELGLCGDRQAPHYAAAKGAVHGLVKSVGAELARRGLRINCVAPGPTRTPLLESDLNAPLYPERLPIGRLLEPPEVAQLVASVLLEDTNIVAQVISPNGGAAL